MQQWLTIGAALALEVAALAFAVLVCWIGVAFGWHALGLREGAMFAWGLAVVVPLACVVPFAAMRHATAMLKRGRRDHGGRT